MTEAEAAERLGVDDRHLRRVEAGSFNLGLGTLLKLANVYEVDPSVLLRPRRRPLPKRPRGRPMSRRAGPQ